MTLDELKVVADYGSLALALVSLLISLGLAVSARKRASRAEVVEMIQDGDKALEEDFGNLQDQVRTLDVRMTRLSEKVDHLPDHRDLEQIHARVSEVKNGLHSVAQAVSGLTASIEQMGRSFNSVERTLQQLVDNELAEARDAKKRG